MTAARVAVVGAGIVGAAIARHLAHAGAAVTVIDGAGPGGLATPRSWAWINASWGNPPDYARLRIRSIADWRTLGAEVPGLTVNWCGGLLWDIAPDDLAAFVVERRTQGYDIRVVERSEAAMIEPALADPPALAAHAPCEGAVEPAEATAALLRDAARHGARLAFGRAAEGVAMRGGRAAGMRLADGEVLAFDHVVLAAGTATPALAATAGVVVPLEAPPGLLVTTEPAPGLVRGLVMAPAAHVRALPDGRLLVGTDFAGTDPGDDPDGAAAHCMGALRDLFGNRAPAQQGYAVGHRPMPPDGRPIVGEVAPGLHVCVTHSGVTLAAALGRLVAAEVLAAERDDLLAPYRPGRFAAVAAQ